MGAGDLDIDYDDTADYRIRNALILYLVYRLRFSATGKCPHYRAKEVSSET